MIGLRDPDVHAIVLAGGDGQGLAPLTTEGLPKALLCVGNRPAIAYSILALVRAGLKRVTVVSRTAEVGAVASVVENLVPADVTVDVVGRDTDHGTADVLRTLGSDLSAEIILVVSSDTVCDAPLEPFLSHHMNSNASCSVLLAEDEEASSSGLSVKKKPPGGKKEKKATSASPAVSEPDLYVTTDADGVRLLGIIDDGETVDSSLTIRPSLLKRFADLRVKANMRDPHVYAFSSWVLRSLLPARPQISSVRLDLVPYLARRQFSLARAAVVEDWGADLPQGRTSPIFVNVHNTPKGTYLRRITSPDLLLSTSLEIAGGAIESYLDGDSSPPGAGATPAAKNSKSAKKGPKSAAKAESPFATTGERTNVSADSVVGKECSAGDKTSVKKSCVGDGVFLGAGVKMNGCVVMARARIGDGTNLAGCIIGEESVVEGNCVLKNCRVAPGEVVGADTEKEGHDFAGQAETAESGGFMDAFEFS